MKKLVIILGVLLFAQTGFGQVYLEHNKETIIGLYQNLFDSESTPIFSDTNDILKVSLNGSVDKMDAFYYFNNESRYGFDGVGNCYKITLYYFCSPCAEKHLKTILGNKEYKWVKLDENKYISKRKYGWQWNSGKTPNMVGSAVLTINKITNEEKCLELNIVIKTFEKKAWKTLVKKRKN